MRPSVFIGIFVVAIGAMYLVYTLMAADEKPQTIVQQPQVVEKQVPEKLVYVAKMEIPVGTVIDQSMLDKQTFPAHLVQPNFVVVDDKAPKLVGMVARSHFVEREIILTNKVANPNDPSFLAATIEEGMRAVSISVNGITSVAGFIYPGDRVDVLFTHTLVSDHMKAQAKMTEDDDDDIDSSIEIRQNEVIIPNVRVLAVDQKAMAGNEADDKRKRLPSVVTLELTQKDAQRIRLAEQKGEITLVLRSLNDKGVSWERPSLTEDLTRALPPGHFAELFDFDAEFDDDMVRQKVKSSAAQATTAQPKTKSVITVVRGSKVDELEVEIQDAQ